MTKLIDGPFIAPKSGAAKNLVVFLHGYGSNGDDLISIGREWAPYLPDTAFVSPNAPEVCEIWAQGYQWFSIRAIDPDAFEREKQAEKAMPALNAFLDAQLEKWGVPESHLLVVGFSQGAMMAMYTMPRRQRPCAGVIGYSGMLIEAEALKQPQMVKIPVLAIHGDSDEVVPPASLGAIESGFSAAGYDVETVMRPGLGHGIDGFGLTRGLDFIKECLDKAGNSAAA
ncbi:MAG TPA: dienelactone hydrolase family protein [Alphaproteobacteria bacterium]|nr:phospholipase [Rhodospirillaceae bacterium]HRJ67514.1 dienelactone hydrolase family protein [Alphaproteobacteria bacterium]